MSTAQLTIVGNTDPRDDRVIEVDITQDELVMFEGDDENGIFVAGTKSVPDKCVLALGHLRITMTKEQEGKLREYYENT